ncbi:response regulator [Bacteroidales bacterium]|nr:response regulator [Bacteroidales bacterium]
MTIPKILIVEDDDINFLYLKEVLCEINTNILHAKSGPEAVQLFVENNNIQVILMDIKLPGFDGIEAIKQIRELDGDVPIIVQSAGISIHEITLAVNAGSNEYLTKPIDSDEILEVTTRYLNRVVV